MNKSKLLLGVGVLVLVVAIIGAYKYPVALPPLAGTSTQGSTFSSAKFYGVAVNLGAPGANATSSSILNTDANDRYITSIQSGCENLGASFSAYAGAGITSTGLTLKIATSSAAAPAANANTNLVGGTIVIATTTGQWLLSTSTNASSLATVNGLTNPYIIWAANSYLTFTTNATNSAVCTFGVGTIGS